MRALVQRVASAEAEADGRAIGRIGRGLLVYLAVGVEDTPADADWLAEKVANLRIFEDEDDRLNRSVRVVAGAVLAVSDFTLLADARKGRRQAVAAAAKFEQARPIDEAFVTALRREGVNVATGSFGARMVIRSQADGPVNVVIDSPARR